MPGRQDGRTGVYQICDIVKNVVTDQVILFEASLFSVYSLHYTTNILKIHH